MGKGGVALGIIGILIGAGGVGYSFFIWMNQKDIQKTLNLYEIWNSQHESVFYPPVAPNYGIIPNISITFEIKSSRSLFLLFTCSARILNNTISDGFTTIFFYFMLDGVRWETPYTRVGTYEGSPTYNYYSVSLQHYIPEISPGIYNFSVTTTSEYGANLIRENAFTIQSFPI